MWVLLLRECGWGLQPLPRHGRVRNGRVRLPSTFLPLPGYDHDGRRVVIILAGGHDPKLHSMDEVFKATHLISDIMVDEDEQMSITGVVQILDLKGVTAAHALQMSPPLVKKAMTIWQV